MEAVTAEATCIIPTRDLKNILTVLYDALENSRELLAYHNEARGQTTKANRYTTKMYEAEIKDCEQSIEGLKGLLCI